MGITRDLKQLAEAWYNPKNVGDKNLSAALHDAFIEAGFVNIATHFKEPHHEPGRYCVMVFAVENDDLQWLTEREGTW